LSVRIALISDIHGNDVAFAAVVADMERLDVEGCFCLGDVAQGGVQPAESLARLRRLGCRVVMGNSDQFLLEVPAESPEPITPNHLEVRAWTLERLSDDDMSLIGSFEPVVEATVEPGTRLLCCHGSPRSFDDVLLPWSDDEALEPFRGANADVVAGGHTHIQWATRLGQMLITNPGSVGLAYDHHQPQDDFRLTPIAEYAILTGGGRRAAVEFRRVPYSLEDLLAAVRASGRPKADEFAEQWRAGT
jgi:predicted phosphodiesterase